MIFYTIGDWGTNNDGLKQVANSMNKYSIIKKPDFVLSLGDNFYPHGVNSVDDPLWDICYRNMFTAPNLYCTWYSVLGNHDYFQNPKAQIDYYLQKKDERWFMPSNYYTFVRNYATNYATNKTIQVVALDTVLLAVQTSQQLLPHYVINNYNINDIERDKQLQWLEKTLLSSTADWLIVIGHYNIYSGGFHSSNHEMITILKPLFSKYNVDLYACGHCHDLEYLYDDNTHYIVSGAGSKTGPVNQIFQSYFASDKIGFTVHEINDNIMTIKFINPEIGDLYSFNINQKRNI